MTHEKINTYQESGQWIAVFDSYDGAPDSKHIVGWGDTEAEAIADLKERSE